MKPDTNRWVELVIRRWDVAASLLWFVALVCGLVASLCIIPVREQLASGPASNTGFAVLGGPDLSQCTKELNAMSGLVYWRNWTPDKGTVPGRWESQVFKTNRKALIVPLAGYPAAAGNQVYVERLSDGARIRLAYGNCHEKWAECQVILPPEWSEQPLRVVAECNKATNYIGIGPPLAASRMESDLRWAILLFRHGVIVLCFASFLRAIYALVPARLAGSRRERAVIAVLLLAGFGYANFFLLHHGGVMHSLVPSCLLVLTGFVLLLRDFGLRLLNPVRLCRENPEWGGVIVVSLMCVLALYLQQTLSVGFIANYRFYPAQWSTDNQLPMDLTKALSTGANIFDLGWGLWLVSDRPPLLAGLMAIPFTPLEKWNLVGTILPPVVWMNITSIVLLSSWWLAVWVMVQGRAFAVRRQWLVMLTMAMTPFLFFNVIYGWGKLLSATLVLLGIWFDDGKQYPGSAMRSVLVGSFFGLGLLCHGSAVFGIAGYFGYRILLERRKSFWRFSASCLVFFLFALSWSSWAKHYNPPGNALAKFAFTGSFGFETKDQSLTDAIRNAYSDLTFTDWLRMKLEGVKTWLGLYQPYWRPNDDFPKGLDLRALQFLNLAPAIGVLWFGVGSLFRRGALPAIAEAQRLALIGVAGLAVQLLLMWSHHNLHHLSYTIPLFLQLGLVLALTQSRAREWGYVVCWASIVAFFLVWLVAPLVEFERVDVGVLVCCLVGAVFILLQVLTSEKLESGDPK